jgi:hypothetical protein
MFWRQLGFSRLDIAWIDVVRLILPDVVVLVLASVSLSFLHSTIDFGDQVKLVKSPLESEVILFVALFLSTVSLPSLLAMVYLGGLLTIVLPRASAAYPSKPASMSIFIVVALAFTGFNMVIFYLFQFDFFQNASDLQTAQLFGLINLINTTDISSRPEPLSLHAGSYSWPSWVHPFAIFFLYVVLVWS